MVRFKRVDGVVQDKPMSERSKNFRVQGKNAENPGTLERMRRDSLVSKVLA